MIDLRRLGVTFLLATSVLAHGGQYRGPSNVVPPNVTGSGATPAKSGTGGSAASGSGGGLAGQPTAPSTTTPAPSSAGAGTTAAGSLPRGVALSEDLTRWEFWWEFGKDPYLQLREAIYAQRVTVGSDDTFLNPHLRRRARDLQPPTERDLDHVAQRLADTLKAATDRDTRSACLVALAKIGRNLPNQSLHELFVPLLQSHDQELRETAALAIGIAGHSDSDAVELLIALVQDADAGRKVSQQATVNERTRAFAAYALGLLLARTSQPAVAHAIVDALTKCLRHHDNASRELTVALIEALAQLPNARQEAAFVVLRQGIVDALGAFYDAPLGPGDQLLQAHVPPAIARLATGLTADRWRTRFLEDLATSFARTPRADAKTNVHIAQSCALALGDMLTPWQDEHSPSQPACALLVRAYREHRDQQTRSFAALALAKVGGSAARDALLLEFDRGNRAFEQPWCGVALGVFAARNPGDDGLPPTAIVEPLREAFHTIKNGQTSAALAIALGLCRDTASGDALRAALEANSHRDEVAGYLCIALGLMRDDRAVGPIRALLDASARRPTVMLQAARALGMIGDGAVLDLLCDRLRDPDPSLVRLSALSAALGQIGDRRCLQPLLDMLSNDRLTPLTRAFAAVALGGVCDKDPLPWNSAYASTTNYRAATATLTDGSSGILDIL